MPQVVVLNEDFKLKRCDTQYNLSSDYVDIIIITINLHFHKTNQTPAATSDTPIIAVIIPAPALSPDDKSKGEALIS